MLAGMKERYFTFYDVGGAAWRGEVTIAGNEAVPEWARKVPPLRDGMSNARGQWRLILDGHTATDFMDLTEEQKKLSIARAWNTAALVLSLEQVWDPTHVQ